MKQWSTIKRGKRVKGPVIHHKEDSNIELIKNPINDTTKVSYGIAACRYNAKLEEYEILMIQKRCTYYYVMFVLGKYNVSNNKRLMYLFNGMSNQEKVTIMSMDFSLIYYHMFLTRPESVGRGPSDELAKYMGLKKHFECAFLEDGGIKLRAFISSSQNRGFVWEIPKGRKYRHDEKDIDCAIREFTEETGIKPEDYKLLLHIPPKTMSYVDAGVRYVYYYYIAIHTPKSDKASDFQWKNTSHAMINFNYNAQITEAIDMQWMSLPALRVLDKGGHIHKFTKTLFKILRKKERLGRLIKSGIL